jgi:hypothetical protein
MSWFRDDPNALDLLDPDFEFIDERPASEVGRGVTLARRSVLWLSVAGVSALLTGRSARAQDPAPRADVGHGDLTFPQFLREVFPLAREQVRGGGQGEDTYMMAVAGAITRLADASGGVREAMRAFRREHPADGERFPIMATVMHLKPGGGFEHHDHRDYNGIILGLSGEVRIRNYDILGDDPMPPNGTTFRIRETRDDLILPGRFSMLSRRAENVHQLVAGPDGARVLDVFTFYAKGAGSHWLTVDAKPRDAARRIHDAAWR